MATFDKKSIDDLQALYTNIRNIEIKKKEQVLATTNTLAKILIGKEYKELDIFEDNDDFDTSKPPKVDITRTLQTDLGTFGQANIYCVIADMAEKYKQVVILYLKSISADDKKLAEEIAAYNANQIKQTREFLSSLYKNDTASKPIIDANCKSLYENIHTEYILSDLINNYKAGASGSGGPPPPPKSDSVLREEAAAKITASAIANAAKSGGGKYRLTN